MVFEGSWTVFPRTTTVSLIASGFTAVYAVRLFNRVGFGRLDNERADWQPTSWGERAPAISLTLLVLAAGIWPTALTGWSEAETSLLAVRSQPFLLARVARADAPAIAIAPTSIATAPELLTS